MYINERQRINLYQTLFPGGFQEKPKLCDDPSILCINASEELLVPYTCPKVLNDSKFFHTLFHSIYKIIAGSIEYPPNYGVTKY